MAEGMWWAHIWNMKEEGRDRKGSCIGRAEGRYTGNKGVPVQCGVRQQEASGTVLNCIKYRSYMLQAYTNAQEP